VHAMSYLPGSLAALGALCFVVGVAGSGTSMVGYAGVLPQWFDKRLGLALGVAGLGAGAGVGLSPFIATQLVSQFGWRGAYAALAALALAGGLLAYALLRLRRGEVPPLASRAATASARAVEAAAAPGISRADALRDPRFWLLLAVTFIVPFAILGIALHGAALFIDRGLTAAQAATGAAVAGLGAIIARVGVGALLDRWHAPLVAAVIFVAAGAGLVVNAWATTFALLCIGTFLGGVAMGAEGDLLPFMIRRYFGLRAFGSLFGIQYAAYALGGVLGPIAYGYTFDHFATYSAIMLACAAACGASALAILWMGPYRFRAHA
jgi:MFS transporter, OFA family, oxalate/formate antiporter